MFHSEQAPWHRLDDLYLRVRNRINSIITKLTGNSPLSLPNAVAKPIKSLTQYGLCTQAATPTPSAPVDIVCNNGALRYVALGKNLNGGTIEHKGYTSTGGESTSTTFAGTLWKIPCKEGDKFTASWGGFPDGVSGVFINTWLTDGTWNTRQAISASTSLTYTVGAGVGIINFTLYKTGGVTIGDNAWIQVEYGTSATPYEPFAGMGIKADGTPEVLTVSGVNLLNTATNITGKYISSGGVITNGDDAQYTDLIPVKAGETYVCSLVSGRNSGNNRWHGYNANGTWVKQLTYVSTAEQQGAKLAMFATIDSGISYVRLSYGIADTEAMVKKQNYDPLINTFYLAATANGVPFIKDYSTPVQSPHNGSWSVGVCFEAIPGGEYAFSHDVFANGTYVSGNTLHVGFYEKAEDVTDTSKCLSHLRGVTQFTVPNEAHYVVIEFDGAKPITFSYVGVSKVDNDYSPYVPPQTASVPMLLSVGDYADEAEIISGGVTDRIGIKVLDGTETWTTDTYGGYRRMVLQEVLNASGDTLSVLCSHYVSRAADARQQPNSIFIASTGKLVIYVDSTQNFSTAEEFKSYLAAQYTAGTPVIVVYPLAEETAEQVTAQPLNTSEGTNIVDVTANVSPIQLEVEYAAKRV